MFEILTLLFAKKLVLIHFFELFGNEGGFGEKFFWQNLILDKYLKLCFPKVFFNLKPQEV